jgi:hypothetical protein
MGHSIVKNIEMYRLWVNSPTRHRQNRSILLNCSKLYVDRLVSDHSNHSLLVTSKTMKREQVKNAALGQITALLADDELFGSSSSMG